jgi:hypothetical protein
MRKDIFIIDWLLLIVFVIIILSKLFTIPFAQILQPAFFILIIVHIVQHWRFFILRIKKIFNINK